MDLTTLRTADRGFWRMARLATFVCFVGAGAILAYALLGAEQATATYHAPTASATR